MKLDVEKIKDQVGCTEKEFVEEMGITEEKLRSYCEGTTQMSGELLSKMLVYTGLSPIPGSIFKNENSTTFTPCQIKPNDTFSPSKNAKESLVEYVGQGLVEIEEESVRSEIEKIAGCVKSLRKPRISFAGQSDTGKSTLINALLGAEKMPAKWTPTTSIVVYIKHIDDRPSFINEDVWIMGKRNSEQWNDARLDDKEYCKKFFIAKGDFSLLSTFGTHQDEQKNHEAASCAVAFIDSPLLKDCDILDLPGFAATAEDDALHKFNTQDNVTDILLYLSRSNGFLQDRDLDYLRECIKSLRPIEREGNGINKLENLFVIASQAGTVNNGNNTELMEILKRRCKALCDSYAIAAATNADGTLLPFRSQMTGLTYTEQDFLERFFTYEKDMPRLCKQFNAAFTVLAENLPKAIYKDFTVNLQAVVDGSDNIVRQRVSEWESILENKEKYVDLVREIKEKEPARKVEQEAKNSDMLSAITVLNTESKQDIQTMYDTTMCVDHLVSLIESYGIRNKKDEKQDFATTVNELLSNRIQNILSEKTKIFSDKLDEFLADYEKSFKNLAAGKGVDISFDSTNSFALGLASLGALGASAAWLATSFTAWSVFALGSFAGWGSIIAVGGAIGIAISAVIAGVVALVKALTWKKDLAKKIIKAYTDKNYIETIFGDVDKYWDDTKTSFTTATQRVEDDWQQRIAEYESIADENNIPVLQKKISEAYKGLDFFGKIPMPDVG